ncbi:MAG: class I SAM-dependent methyltransferase [Gammaproteobacteria bacterium]|nr:class I SAM-dependent methyltransferase [Gammaproteobacteria bacterium]
MGQRADVVEVRAVELSRLEKFFYLTNAIDRFSKNSTRPIEILDFGSGQGGLTIDLKRFFGSRINIVGYDVSPRAVQIAQGHKTAYGADVDFMLDQDCDVVTAVGKKTIRHHCIHRRVWARAEPARLFS